MNNRMLLKKLICVLARCWLFYLIILMTGASTEVFLEKYQIVSSGYFTMNIRWIYAAIASVIQFFLLVKWTKTRTVPSCDDGCAGNVCKDKLAWIVTAVSVIIVAMLGFAITVYSNLNGTFSICVYSKVDMKMLQILSDYMVVYFNQAGILYFIFGEIVPEQFDYRKLSWKSRTILLFLMVASLEVMPLSFLSCEPFSVVLLSLIYLAIWQRGVNVKNIMVLHVIYVVVSGSINFCSFVSNS